MIVYKATSPSGKCYIGISKRSLKERIRYHIIAAKSGSRKAKFQKALLKYKNKIKWEIIDKTESLKFALELEKYYIYYYNSYKEGYNCTLGGDGNWGWVPSLETRNKLRISNIGKKRSKKTRENMSKAKLGKKYKSRNIYKTRKSFALIKNGEVDSVWNNASACARYLKTHPASVSRCLLHPKKFKSYKNYTIAYVEEGSDNFKI